MPVFRAEWCNRSDEASAVVLFMFQHQTLVTEGDGLTVFGNLLTCVLKT